MKVRRHSKEYNFYGDTETGLTIRFGKTVNDNPITAPWPELADISISNHCTKGCEFCYRDSTDNNSFMSTAEYEYVLDSLTSSKWGSVFQVALGGGEPLEHPDFIEILDISKRKGIVANFTTNGIHINEIVAKNLVGRVGAVAISTRNIDEVEINKLRLLIDNGIKTNLHFVLDKKSIHNAIELLEGKYNDVLNGLNGVIFLTYKPKGRANTEDCLTIDKTFEKFTNMIDNNSCGIRIGFDACFVPVLMKYTDTNVDYIDSCECGFFSIYIDENSNVKPCSFANNDRYSYNLKEYTMEEIWNQKYQEYRREISNNICINECKNKNTCRGKCMYFEELSLCFKE